ncbi:iron-sulfur cluster biosynthesis family protein [Calditerricola satsumensis]|uniref:Core domain-containing protein n=1 Tax=Calditerricola satsumensis TaxID=373054 RepID=A0A8J3FCL5_9BACI|nr:iron-sulfur cluster biosynthesis family protein [Calditerricola satsumensis]GGK06837.1 hypothetical protein GCM10007043_21150 [Calditerricola satsumensis]
MALRLIITEKAAEFYRQELDVQEGEALRLFVRIGGVGHVGYSFGIQKDRITPHDHVVRVRDVAFVVRDDDAWYLDGMTIDLDGSDEIVVSHERFARLDHPVEEREPALVG